MEPDDHLIRAGTDGVIRFWGSGIEAILGHTSAQAMGSSVELIIPPPLRGLHWRGFDKAIERGEVKKPGSTVRVPAVHRDGTIVPVRADIGLTRDADGNVDGASTSNVRLDAPWMVVAWRPVLALLAAIGALHRLVRRKRP